MTDQKTNGSGAIPPADLAGDKTPASPSAEPLTAIGIDVLLRRASKFYDAGYLDAAFQLAMEVASRRPDHVEALLTVAHSLREMGRFDEALKVLGRIRQLSPDHHRAAAAYALTLFYKQDWT